MTDYDRGFSDGLRWVADVLRRSASLVEQPKYGDFSRSNGGASVRAISEVGQVHFARQLREVASTIEQAIQESQ